MEEIFDFQNLCRICLKKMENMTSIFEGILNPHVVSYKDMIEECACIEILTDKVLPKKICYKCSKWLKISYKLKIKCLVAEEIIKNEIKKAKINLVTEENEKVPEDAGWWINLDDYDYNVPLNSEIEVVITDGNERKSAPTGSSLIDTDNNVHNAEFNCDYNLPLNSKIKENANKFELTESGLKNANNNANTTEFKCQWNECNERFSTEMDYLSHFEAVHLKEPLHHNWLTCNLCDERFKNQLEFDIHSLTKIRQCKKKYKEKQALIKQALKKVHQCIDCNKLFKTRSALKWHEDRHLGLQSLCPYCGKIVASSSLKNHLKQHSKETRNCCEICGFKTRYSIVEHLKTHTQEKKYECEICKNRFTTRKSLTQHEERHIKYGERKCVCNVCGKRFLRKDTLRKHHIIHTGERKHICHICNKPFKTPDNLRQHLRTHSGIKRFVCNRCGRGFSAKHVLNKHLTTHCKAPSLEL